MQEFKRQCMACGTVWHSLVSRENELIKREKSATTIACGDAVGACGTCNAEGEAAANSSQRNLDAIKGDLHRLRTCPTCQSSAYQETLITYANRSG